MRDWRADLIGALRLCGFFGREDRRMLRLCLGTKVELKTEDLSMKTARPFPGSRKFYDVGKRLDGDWDIAARVSVLGHAQSIGLYPEIFDFFDRKIECDQIPAFKNAVEGGGRKWRSSRDAELLRAYAQRLREMYETMASRGYVRRKQSRSRLLSIRHQLCEVCIDIGREGQALFVDGLHRYLIAHKLDIPVVCQPVIIHREFRANAGSPFAKLSVEAP